MQRMLDSSDCAVFFNALQEEPRVSVRWNKAKAQALSAHSVIASKAKQSPANGLRLPRRSFLTPRNDDEDSSVAWCDSGYYLPQRPIFTLDPLLHGGAYYVQEASSMFLAHIVRQITEENTPLVALDLCAAPGGKSTLLADFLPTNSLLVANEVIRSRVNILAENLTKWGNPNVVVTNNDPKDFSRLPELFDAIFVDAPCSGEGMFRKDEKARGEWSEDNVRLCAERQRRIVADVWSGLKVGGYLVYSTCTFNIKENEENVRWIMQELDAESIKIEVPKEWRITLSEELQAEATQGIYGYRFFPHKVKGEGFFVAVLRKNKPRHSELVEESQTIGRRLASPSSTSLRLPRRSCLAPRNDGFVKSWLSNPNDFTFSQAGDFIKAFPLRFDECKSLLNNELRIIQGGITLAEIKGKDYIPHYSLALSTALNVEAFPAIDLDLHNALLYLKKETFASPSQNKGFELVRYNGLPLGFVKNLGNRCNNLFPQEWRIRMQLSNE